MRILLTGAAGSIGRTLVRGLPPLGHEIRGLDLVPGEADACALGWITGDCLDPQVVAEAVRGVDAVVHLAGNPDEDALPASLESHVHSTARLLEAMVEHGVGRMVYASSNHAVGRTPRGDRLTTDVRPRPDTFYGVAKVAAEALLSLYADQHDIASTALRIGTFEQRPSTVRALSTWLSPDDAVRLADAAVTSTTPGLAIVNGISANSRGWWDLGPGRAMGYAPKDDAETYADQVSPRPEDEDEAAHVGGSFATDPPRPAF
ncbi:NAD-dependent epimerase/dehydratase family protein [Aeromicrobium sp. S22]|uniref:NAD-dependent epimerase/dehydratase family protein n=1 Tax=Aeromicrobium sp. S22 TaxID=2662029 RepID=UPI00129D28A1|nr:NAD(P)-dependent oxidoreductase [Aeromicrobium sp. S22]MRK02920.1 NAD-dependent epimerase/dehydratase family protein [Aeromicrobium sp. S22]